ncbi:hypothetical protein J1N35_018243 [Gossypium stocksii]|uniref:Uncharacterized protein n=1 Tax=Gossypium stocksii TaxID=47602 RepID=A0A9D4A710_9ROSI|nr:hypothetical protein J1N35_018243 [Gossypium stocksii]
MTNTCSCYIEFQEYYRGLTGGSLSFKYMAFSCGLNFVNEGCEKFRQRLLHENMEQRLFWQQQQFALV